MLEKDEIWYRTLPKFDGEDPFGWLFRIEKYFLDNSMVEEDEKLEVAVACLVGKAMNWCIWFENRATIHSWSEFKREIIKRFHEMFSAKQVLIQEREENKSAEALYARMQEKDDGEEVKTAEKIDGERAQGSLHFDGVLVEMGTEEVQTSQVEEIVEGSSEGDDFIGEIVVEDDYWDGEYVSATHLAGEYEEESQAEINFISEPRYINKRRNTNKRRRSCCFQEKKTFCRCERP